MDNSTKLPLPARFEIGRIPGAKEKTLVAAFILALSTVALIHFGVYYWRAVMLTIAAGDLSERAQSLAHGSVGADDFAAWVCLREMCPDLAHKSRRLGAVAAYYRAVSFLRSAFSFVNPVSNWANREMAACSRYVAVITDQRVQANLAAVARIHSY